MTADISAHTFRPARHFAAVVVGQGQALVDSAMNEQEEIARHRVGVTTSDVVGLSGVPKDTGGFGVSVAPDGRDLLVSPGRIYVDGILCVNEPQIVEATVVSATEVKVDVAAPDGTAFAAGQWVEVIASGGRIRAQLAPGVTGQNLVLASAPGLPAAATRVQLQRVTSLRCQPDRFAFDPFDPSDSEHVSAGAYRVELDVWHRDVSPVEDASIREVALGDAESATRLKVVWQLRLAAAGGVGGGSCSAGIAAQPGQLLASTIPGPPSDEPCVLPDEAGYRGLENQLYRVEVHSSSASEVVLKWQRDNASTASRLISLGTTLLLEDMGRDDERGFVQARYVEVTDDALELEQRPSDLLQVITPDKGHRTVTVAAAPAAARLNRRAAARRWDGRIVIDLTSPTAGQPVLLERGVQVALVPGVLRPGDYWLVPARTSNSAGGGTIGWPSDDGGKPLAQPPQGIEHHLTALALVDTDAAQFLRGAGTVRECRRPFPALTELDASDVSVDPTACGLVGVSTVQQAIDAVCNRGGGLCTVTATPGSGWEKVFDGIAAGADAQVCFPVGSYTAAKPVHVTGKGHLVLQGAGLGAALTGTAFETVLSFSSCASVTVQSLEVESSGAGVAEKGLAGALSFTDCADVTVSECRIACSSYDHRRSSCLRVAGGNLRVQGTLFEVGDRQVGLLAVNTAHTVVSGNRFVVAQPPGRPIGGGGGGAAGIEAATKLERQQARRLLISNLSTAAASGQRVGVTIGQQPMSFATTPIGKAAWPGLLLPAYDTMQDFQKAIDKVLRGVFAGSPVAGASSLTTFVEGRILGRRVAVMAQAMVVGGKTVGDVRIESNTVEAAIQGVHIGVSHRLQPRSGPADIVGRVSVTGNKVRVLVPPEGARARHAIFVGNADRLRISENDMSYEGRAEGDRITTDGIRIFGFIGRMMTVRENAIDSFPRGMTLHLLMLRGSDQASLARMWAVENNLIIGASPEVTVAGPLRRHVKLRGNRPGPADN